MPKENILTRAIKGDIQRAEGNTYRLSFSSETPVIRWGVKEILDHADGAADLTRLNEMGVLLFNHDCDKVVGRVVRAWVEGGRGCAEVAFDEDEESQRIHDKVDAGTLKGVSGRFRICSVESVLPGATSADGRFAGPVDIIRKWEAVELSIASIPADATVGVGRSYDTDPINDIEREETPLDNEMDNTLSNSIPPVAAAAVSAAVPAAVPANPIIPAVSTAETERKRVLDITEICRTAALDPAEFIRTGVTVEEALRKANEALLNGRGPIDVRVTRDEGDKFRAAASDALLMRAGITPDKPVDGAPELRALSLRDLALETLAQEGKASYRMSNDELLNEISRAFLTPTAAFPAILDQTVDKAYRKGYETTPTTYERFTSKGSLSDFKETKSWYLMGNANDFLLVPENGELKHDIPRDHTRPGRKLETYGRQFTLSRQAFINDDIGLITSIPMRYAAAAKRTINKQVYEALTGNPVVYDGETLFSAEHGNDYTPSAPTSDSIQGMMNVLKLMKDDDGNPIVVVPRYILAPVGRASAIWQLLNTPTVVVNTGGVTTGLTNPLYGRGLEIIEDPFLNILADEKGWYMMADPTVIPAIQVDYLNGNEIPSIRRSEVAGQLGFVWDIYLDWGVSVLEYRGIVRNKGE